RCRRSLALSFTSSVLDQLDIAAQASAKRRTMTMPNAVPCGPMRNMTDNPLQNVTFPSNGSTAHGYLALPESGSGPGLIVIQEWWGLVDHIADVTNRFAAEGFVALAPD